MPEHVCKDNGNSQNEHNKAVPLVFRVVLLRFLVNEVWEDHIKSRSKKYKGIAVIGWIDWMRQFIDIELSIVVVVDVQNMNKDCRASNNQVLTMILVEGWRS